MRPRRVALLLVACLMAATSSLGATATRAVSATTASAKICVALVVDAHSIRSNVSTSCAKVSKGATGVDVLRAAGHSLRFRNDSLICAIDGLPRSGCSAVDDTHYWAYFHRAAGKTSWTYSTDNESTYQPAIDSTEGWVYDDGTKLTPKNVPYTKICKPDPKPTPSPTATHHRSHRPSPTPTPHHSTAAHHSSAPTTSTSPSSSPRPHPTRSAGSRHRQKSHHHNLILNTSQSVKTRTARPSPTSAALVGGSPPSSSSHHGILELVIGLVVVAALGGFAALRFRRSS